MRTRLRHLFSLSCAAVVWIAQPALAQETKEEDVGQAERNILVGKPLPGVDGKIVSINHFTLAPEYVGGKHYHSGPTYLYVLKGTLTIEEEGKPTRTLETGQVFEEPIGSPHQSSNQSADEPIELLMIQVQPFVYQCPPRWGEPLTMVECRAAADVGASDQLQHRCGRSPMVNLPFPGRCLAELPVSHAQLGCPSAQLRRRPSGIACSTSLGDAVEHAEAGVQIEQRGGWRLRGGLHQDRLLAVFWRNAARHRPPPARAEAYRARW